MAEYYHKTGHESLAYDLPSEVCKRMLLRTEGDIKEAIEDEVYATSSTIEGRWEVGEIPEEYSKPTPTMMKAEQNKEAWGKRSEELRERRKKNLAHQAKEEESSDLSEYEGEHHNLDSETD